MHPPEENRAMKGYKKRNREDEISSEERTRSPFEEQEELVLRLDSKELFDPHVLLPHAELNEVVYKCVNHFVSRYRGDKLTLSIFTDTDNEAVRSTFREVYRAHYEDEYQQINRHLKRRYVRLFILLAVSLTAFWLWDLLAENASGHHILLTIMTNVGAFCLWETAYTQFARQDALAERQRIMRARDAEIVFHASKGSGSAHP